MQRKVEDEIEPSIDATGPIIDLFSFIFVHTRIIMNDFYEENNDLQNSELSLGKTLQK